MSVLKLFEEPGMVALTPREAAAVKAALAEAADTRNQLLEIQAVVAKLRKEVESLKWLEREVGRSTAELQNYKTDLVVMESRCAEYERLIYQMLGEQDGKAYIKSVKSGFTEEYANFDGFA